MTLSADDQALVDAAVAVRERAYAPYSGFRVGAALRLRNGSVVTGVNVENCSYGLTVCAERHAVAAAVLEGAESGDIARIAIVAEADRPTPPCGACRQVLAELSSQDAEVIAYNLADGATLILPLSDLLPEAFARDNMP